MLKEKCEIGLYGLGVMGTSLATNMLNHGLHTAVYSKSDRERTEFHPVGREEQYVVCGSEEEFCRQLRTPRIIFLMITAGRAVDDVIESLSGNLEPGDVLIDGGNSYYQDTARRYRSLTEKGIHFLGVGVSGGQKGALAGPSMMAGGDRKGWETCRHILEMISASYVGQPCCKYLGEAGAGHYVKMVHNGIEYGILQLISEVYEYLRSGLGAAHEDILRLFRSWKDTELSSYLIEISIAVLEKEDEDGKPLVEKILDRAAQKGTGFWTVQESLALGIYTPTLLEAVQIRTFSGREAARKLGSTSVPQAKSIPLFNTLGEKQEGMLRDALFWGMVCCFSQGLEVIAAASERYGWNIPTESAIQVWKSGCIIRCALLDEIQNALKTGEGALICREYWSDKERRIRSVRELAANGILSAIPCGGLASVVNYCEYYQSEYLPVRFLQGLRDCFGAHTYERTDRPGNFHTEWE